MYILPLALTAIGVLFDLVSLIALLVTLVRQRLTSGFPAVALFFYLPTAILALFGYHPPRFSLAETLLILAALSAIHVLIQWAHFRLMLRIQSDRG